MSCRVSECELIDCRHNSWRGSRKFRCAYIGVISIDENGCKNYVKWGR